MSLLPLRRSRCFPCIEAEKTEVRGTDNSLVHCFNKYSGFTLSGPVTFLVQLLQQALHLCLCQHPSDQFLALLVQMRQRMVGVFHSHLFHEDGSEQLSLLAGSGHHSILPDESRNIFFSLSTESTLTTVTNKLHTNTEDKKISLMTLCPLSKAFDSIN